MVRQAGSETRYQPVAQPPRLPQVQRGAVIQREGLGRHGLDDVTDSLGPDVRHGMSLNGTDIGQNPVTMLYLELLGKPFHPGGCNLL